MTDLRKTYLLSKLAAQYKRRLNQYQIIKRTVGPVHTKALCVFTNVPANAMIARTLINALDRVPGLDPTYVTVGGDDYAKNTAP